MRPLKNRSAERLEVRNLLAAVTRSDIGELALNVIADQFERIRDGDRLWYENVFSGQQLAEIDSTTLADVIERNTNITGLGDNVFFDSPGKMHDSMGRKMQLAQADDLTGEESLLVPFDLVNARLNDFVARRADVEADSPAISAVAVSRTAGVTVDLPGSVNSEQIERLRESLAQRRESATPTEAVDDVFWS